MGEVHVFRSAAVVLILMLAGAAWPLPALPQQGGGDVEVKPDAALAPLAAIGDISEGEAGILFNSLQSALSASFRLISQQEFAKAQDRAFEELELENCTAEQCIRKIQDILQVERLFVLQIIREGTYTQLTLTLSRLEDRSVRTDTCRDCDIAALDAKLAGLVATLVARDAGAAPPLAAKPPPPLVTPQPEPAREPPADAAPAPEADAVSEAGGGSQAWLSVGLGIVAVAAYVTASSQSTQAENKYDEAQTSQSAATYDEAQAKEDDAATNLVIAQLATLGALISWWLTPDAPESPAAAANVPNAGFAANRWRVLPSLAAGGRRPGLALTLSHRW